MGITTFLVPETQDVKIMFTRRQSSHLPHQVFNMYPCPAVDMGGVLIGQNQRFHWSHLYVGDKTGEAELCSGSFFLRKTTPRGGSTRFREKENPCAGTGEVSICP